jgi:hypothetical protein
MKTVPVSSEIWKHFSFSAAEQFFNPELGDKQKRTDTNDGKSFYFTCERRLTTALNHLFEASH